MYQAQRNEPQYDEAAALGILQHLNKTELEKLLDDESKLGEIIADLPQVKSFEGQKEDALAKNKSLAEYNLSMEPKLVQAKEQLAYTYEEAVKYQKSFEQKKQKLDYQAAQVSLDTTHALLQTEVAKAEEDSEELSDKFLDGNVEDSQFIDGYFKKRTNAHMCRVRAEKMAELITQRQRGGQMQSVSSSIMASTASTAQSAAPAGGYSGPGYKPSQPPYPMPYGAGAWGQTPAYSAPSVSMPNPSAYFPR